MKCACSLVFASLSLILGGCTSVTSGLAGNPAAVQVTQELGMPDSTVPEANQAFRIGPFDGLRVDVLGVADLSRDMTVDASGTIALPLIGQVVAAGRTTSELSADIANRLRGRYLRDPQVTVGVSEIRSARVTVDGAVAQPGLYPVLGNTTLVRAIATAHGLSDVARPDQVVVFRMVNRQQMAALFDLRGIREGRLADPVIYGGDVIVVGESRTRRLFRDLIQTLPSLGVFAPVIRSGL
jgi:polysaccharide export outer membrane protein